MAKLIRQKTAQTIELNGQSVPFTLIRSSRAKHWSLKVSPQAGLEVIVPLRTNLSKVPRFLQQKQDWIKKHTPASIPGAQQTDPERSRGSAPVPQGTPPFKDGTQITILEVPHTIRLYPTRKSHPYVKKARALKFAADHAYYDGHELLIYANTLQDAARALEKHLRLLTKKHFTQRTHELAAAMNLTFGRITIRAQKSRWGSCSRQKNLNFNWRLIFMPLATIDSVIIHELAHTKHLNHGPAFKALLQAHCPDHKKHSSLLKKARFIM